MIVLDTHVLVWWINGDKQLSKSARTAINSELAADDGIIMVSSISAWEIAMLVNADRLILTMGLDDWLKTVSEIDAVRFVAVENEVAVASTKLLGEFHKDPADRMIVALARHHNVVLVTADKKIHDYKHVKSVW